ncbi:calcyclin binding protein, putative [Plasmodium ovale wallikeri]|uniref:Calcyclin binding protein, putative n=2 Tax=Plasmodium ovale TaxID=36330 RepID=A0A1A8YRZ3_PLAOA|nr:calcyclin binding protein, putative [Plasmodium ovale wallikeri]SBT35528.1 calcyclin binding protein, putative [Plasmodium ovale wallikeri]SBT76525.1 calcyclin binding protein, putative [Plasmodium ovale]
MDNEKIPSHVIFANAELEELTNLKRTKVLASEKTIRHDWSQTETCVFFTLYKKNIQANSFLYFVKSDYIFLTIKINDEEVYAIDTFLFSEIEPSKTRINITPMKVEVTLEKETKGLKWIQISKVEKDITSEKKENLLNPFSGKSTQEWDNLTKTLKEEDEGESIDHFFRKIYKDGDDDTRRAMIKSFQTSHGTVLSTNWKDVKNKNYEKVGGM